MEAADHEAQSTLKGKTQHHEQSYACLTQARVSTRRVDAREILTKSCPRRSLSTVYLQCDMVNPSLQYFALRAGGFCYDESTQTRCSSGDGSGGFRWGIFWRGDARGVARKIACKLV